MILKYESYLAERFHAFWVGSIEFDLHFGFQPLGINPVDMQIKELLEIGT
jgi:hypothetical protein